MSVEKLKKRLERLVGKDGRDEDIMEILHQLNSIPMSIEILKETHIGKTVNRLKKRKGVIGRCALNLVDSWKQLVSDVDVPKPKVVVEEPSYSPVEEEDEEPSVTSAGLIDHNHLRFPHVKKSPSPNQNLRTFNMFEGMKQPSYSHVKPRSPSPMLSSPSSSYSESPSTSVQLPVADKSRSPQPKRKLPITDVSGVDSAALSKRSRTQTQVYSGKRTGSQVVLPLFEMALKVLMSNINALEEVRGVPYRIMEPVLARCSPSQLQRLESFNPHFLGYGDSLWDRHCQREFKGVRPCSGQTWRDLYMEQVEMREDRLKKISDNIKGKKAQQEPARTVKMAEAGRMRRRRTAQVFTPTNQSRIKSVTPLMSKTLKMVKERSQMFGSSRKPGR